jgi:flavin reductase (DIM6/NTAB) family NADH-FMN oxidoreductase RutF
MTRQLHLSGPRGSRPPRRRAVHAAPAGAPVGAVDGHQLRRTMGHFATGVAVVTSLDAAGEPVGTTANAISSLSLEPPLVLVCLSRASNTLRAVRAHEAFAINILAADHAEVSNGFAQPGIAPRAWDPLDRRHGATGSPRLPGALAWLDCALERLIPGGDHEIAIGRVLALQSAERDEPPLLFYRGEYALLVRR